MGKIRAGSRVLAILLTVVMLVGLAPSSVAAADGEITVLLSYFNADEDGFPIARQEVKVGAGLSEMYGYTDAYYGATVTALDAIVAAHVIVFGDDAANISANLTVSNTGFITNFMGIGSDFVYFVNGELMGAGPSLIQLGDGDVVELAALQDIVGSFAAWGDAYIWFELGGDRVDKITVGADEPFTLSLAGIDCVIYRNYGSYDSEFDEYAVVIDMLMDTPPSAVWNAGVVYEESSDGDVYLEFDTPGTYYLTAVGETYDEWPMMGPWLEVTVTDGGGAATGTNSIVNPQPSPQSPGEPGLTWQEALSNTLIYIVETQAPAPVYGDEWGVLALARGGYPVPTDYFEGYYESVKAALIAQNTNKPKEPGGGANQPTTNSRLILALTAIGADATDVEGFDLLAPLTDLTAVKNQGLNSAVYALLAMDSKPYALDPVTKDALIEYILSAELPGGGFNWGWGTDAEPDMTAMVLQALAPYYGKGDAALDGVIDDALGALETMQEFGGGYESWGAVGAENSAQVIVAATALGMDPAVDLVKDKDAVDFGYDGAGNDNPLYSMLRFYMDTTPSRDTGGFQSGWAPGFIDSMATQQAGYALVAYARYDNGDNTLFDMSDCDITLGTLSSLNIYLLEALIAKAEALTQSDYTSSTWNAMTAKLDTAIAVLTDGLIDLAPARQAGVNQAANELNAAITALVPYSGSGDVSTNISIAVYVKVPPQSRTAVYTYKKNAAGYTDLITPETVSVPSGSSALFILEEALKARSVSYSERSGYVSAIGDWAEGDPYPGSGWLFMVGSTVPTAGANVYRIDANSTVIWFFTDDYSNEYGSENWSNSSGGGGSSGGTVAGADVVSVINVTPTVSEGKAGVTVSDKQIEDALGSTLQTLAEKDAGTVGEITVRVGAYETKEVSVKFTAKSFKGLAAEKDVLLTVETKTAALTFDSAAIDAITSGAGDGAEVEITVRSLAASDLSDANKVIVGGNPVFEFTVKTAGALITSFGDGNVSVFLPYEPKNGEDTSALTVYYLEGDGVVEEMKGAVYDTDLGGFVFTTNHFSVFFIAAVENAGDSVWSNPFRDVGETDWFYDAVRYVNSNGLMVGTAPDMFSPNLNLSRAMAVSIFYNAEYRMQNAELQENAVNTPLSTLLAPNFSDVLADAWYYDAVVWASNKGIVSGYGDGFFGPGDVVSREQLASMLYNYARAKNLNISSVADLSVGNYSDAVNISPWASESMNWANSLGLITGRTATAIAPRDAVSRAETAAILQRFTKII